MPVTPFHFGPGVLIKSVVPRWFSLRAFILVQVVIDFETAWNIVRGNNRLHTVFHSYMGATVAMLCAFGLVVLSNAIIRQVQARPFQLRSFEIRSSVFGIIVGGWSHVFLDSIMHADLYPFYPLGRQQPQLAMWSLEKLHAICLLGFVLGGVILIIRSVAEYLRGKGRNNSPGA